MSRGEILKHALHSALGLQVEVLFGISGGAHICPVSACPALQHPPAAAGPRAAAFASLSGSWDTLSL